MAANKETVCSFQEIVGGHCGFQTKDRSKSVEVLPLLQCKRNIGAHKSALALTGVENEVDLILSRASMFAPPRNVEKLNICPRHRESLGLGWRRPSSKCSIPNVLSSHSAKAKERPKAERGITKWMSEHILRETGILVPVGSSTINYEKKLRDRILTQAWERRREILIGNRCSHLFSLLYINAPFQSKALWLVFNLQVCAATVLSMSTVYSEKMWVLVSVTFMDNVNGWRYLKIWGTFVTKCLSIPHFLYKYYAIFFVIQNRKRIEKSFNRTAETRDSKRNAAKQHSMIPACPDCPGLLRRDSPFLSKLVS